MLTTPVVPGVGGPSAAALAQAPGPQGSGSQGAIESPEAATAGLLSYLLPEDAAPAGYSFAFTRAYDNPAQTLDSLTTVPPDPRQPSDILQALASAGRVVRLVQGVEPDESDSAAGLRTGLVLFRDADAATRALKDPSVVAIVSPRDQITPATPPSPILGDGSAQYRIDFRDEAGGFTDRSHLLVWRQGRILFTVFAFGKADLADAALPAVNDLARAYNARVAGLPAPPASFGPSQLAMPSEQTLVDRYLQLRDRLLPDDVAGPNFKLFDTFSVNNSILVLDSRDASPPLTDPAVVIDRLVTRQHRLVGVVRWLETRPEAANPPETSLPEVSFGYHLYADAAGATQALQAPVEEVALRLYQEASFNKPSEITLAEVPLSGIQVGSLSLPPALGDQSRAFATTYTDTSINVTAALVSVRWRRGPVELFVNTIALPTLDVTALATQLVQQLDAAYLANPLPGI